MATPEELLLLLDRRLAILRKTRPDLGEALHLQEQLVRTSLAAARPPRADPFPLPREHLAARLREGVPILHDQPVQVDLHFAADLFSRLVNTLQQREDAELGQGLEDVVAAATNGALDPQRLFVEAFVHHEDHLAEMAHGAGLEPELLATLATLSVAPVLRAYAEHLRPFIERLDDGSPEGTAWHRGYCPICGGWPLLGELRGVELAHYLRCAGCGSGWRAQRLGCSYCGNEDFRSLQSLTVEGEQRFRVSVCERCHGYLKVGNAFDPPPAELLAIDDAASLHLDVAAIERGYQRPMGSGFRIELAVPEEAWLEAEEA
ncbi:MAG TPA: formate dehydrogenase accessory protein FdhE [Chloroflexota bacterium]|jgi:FdhE protein|nr:formate dehydrogenase accessory protein FdhE [Chloroflexota bacterium]